DREATFIPTPGLRRPGAATACSRVVIAGAWTNTGWPATMESAVRSGRAAARCIAGQLRQAG
ncbi:MAG TPA: FAD-dependent oxidoreductase, partial [Chloroflexota bacterium]|nr:FAD-dependent oxidoreductase [Chloroflexota bacterium]